MNYDNSALESACRIKLMNAVSIAGTRHLKLKLYESLLFHDI